MPRNFIDKCVIYESREDDCWIAHSLRTDQIGTGGCVVEALADLMRAVNQIHELAERDKTVAVLRPAPADIQKMAKESKKLPREIYEIAYKRVMGKWPEDKLDDWEPPKGESFKAELKELAVA